MIWVGDVSPGVPKEMPELELFPWISLSLKKQDYPGQVIASAFQLRIMGIHSVKCWLSQLGDGNSP